MPRREPEGTRPPRIDPGAEPTPLEDVVEGAELHGCRLERAALDGARLPRLDLTDARLERCSLANAHLLHARFTRVELRGCRLTGVELAESGALSRWLTGVCAQVIAEAPCSVTVVRPPRES